jgi:hypothetical protein
MTSDHRGEQKPHNFEELGDCTTPSISKRLLFTLYVFNLVKNACIFLPILPSITAF